MKIIQSKALINQGTLIVRLVIAKDDKHFVLSKTKEGTLIFPSTSDGVITSYQSCGGGKDMSLQECIDLISKQDWHSSCLTHGTHVNYKSQLKKLGETLGGGGDIKENFSISKPPPRDITNDIKDKTLQLLGQTWATDNVDDQLYQCILTSEDGLELLETWLRFYLDHYKDTNNGTVLAAIPSQCIAVAKRCAAKGLLCEAHDVLMLAFSTDHPYAKWMRNNNKLMLHQLCNAKVLINNYNKWLQHTHTPKSFVVEAMPQLEAPVYDEDGFLIGGYDGKA
jgi:hypothetical protein